MVDTLVFPTYGNLTLDGNLTDWTLLERLDYVPQTRVEGYEIYGKFVENTYVFAISSDSQPIDMNTTFWLNTDQNRNTGYKVFGFAGGVEYVVNFNTTPSGSGSAPFLYQIDSSGNIIAGTEQILNYTYGNNNQIVEFAIPLPSFNNSPQKLELLADVNNQVFLPPDYSYNPYSVSTTPLPTRTDFSKKVAIIFSQTTAQNFFGDKAYTQLFLSMQYQAMMAGIPFDILTEDDLTNINKLVNYDALIFPSFRNVKLEQLSAIEETLVQAVYKYKIGIITAGDFLTNDQNNNPLAGDSYQRMKSLLDVTRTGGGNSANGTLQADSISHPVMDGYTANELIRSYNGISYNTYGDGLADRNNPITLADFVVNGQRNNAVLATQTGGRNVHFATEGFMADNNLLWEALRWVIFDDKPTLRLNMSRNNGIMISRTDMDQSQESYDVNPDGNTPGIYDLLIPILQKWKTDYNFVGSYYINVGNNESEGQFTDWTISKSYYDQMLALGNEIGTHSYTHPDFTGSLTPQQLEFEFNQSQLVIEQQLGINVTGAAIPGNPEPIYVSQQINQYLSYVSGGYSGVGAGYPGAFGFMFPNNNNFVYLAPNLSFDFSLIEFRQLTTQQAEAAWTQEYNNIASHAAQPIFHWPWHDYGPTIWQTNPPNPAPAYTLDLFTNFIARAYNDNQEFITAEELNDRIRTFDQSKLFLQTIQNTINASISGTNLGAFALNLDDELKKSNQKIQSVNNWYAYDLDSIFLPQNGGNFTINLGTTVTDVTHITNLPMRAELLSLSGDGSNLEFTFVGNGTVVIDLKNPDGGNYFTQGADSILVSGEILLMQFNTLGQHTGKITFIGDAPPTVANPITDITVDEDAADTLINLANVFTDPDNSNAQIVKTIFSNTNPSLIIASIVNNTLSLDYLTNQFGTAQITIQGTSNGKSVQDTFTVTVNPIDDAPTVINPITDISVNENASDTIINLSNVFTDIDNDPAAIVKTLVSNSNSTLVNATIVNNTLTLDYLANQSGTAQITVRGTSNGKTVDDIFFVNVGQVDKPPIVINPISDLTVNEDAANSIIDLTNVFTDIDNDPIAIIKTVVNNTNNTLVNAAINNNTLTLSYQPNQFGTAQITIRGTSNGQTIEDTFTVTVNPVDDAPIVINPIKDINVNEDAANSIIDLTNVFSDIDNDPTAIIKTIVNNTNNTLVNAAINNNTLTLSYQPNQSGTAQITIRATSNGQTVEDTFIVTVGAVDDPPVMANPIADITVNEDATSTIIDLTNVFTDIEGDSIVKSVFSNSNSTLVNASITDNTLTLNYQPNQFGTAQITIRGTSNGQTVEDTFIVTVNPIDDAPTVINPIADIIVSPNSDDTIIDLSQVFTDIDNDIAAITKTVSANSNSTLVNPTIIGNTLTLAYQPNQSGTAQITVQGTSNGQTVEDTFIVTVNPVGNPINGTNGNDTLTGTDQRDVIYGLGGNDTINSKKGDDDVYGGDGNDQIKASDGNDVLFGEGGNDFLEGENQNDTLYGGDGNDSLLGGNDEDSLKGDAGDDSLDGGAGNDGLYGGTGNDTLNGQGQDDLLFGEEGNDSLIGSNNDDTLIGGIGNDTLDGGNDKDTLIGVDPFATNPGVGEIDKLTGGDKADRFILGDANRIYYNDKNDFTQGLGDYALITDFNLSQGDVIQLYGNASNYVIGNAPTGLPTGQAIFYRSFFQNELIAIVQGATSLNLSSSAFTYGTYNPQTLTNTINGTNGNDNIVATAEKEIIKGLAGDDTIDGKEGDDIIYGDGGYDQLKGNLGNDILYGGDLFDKLEGQDGNDTLYGGDGNDDLRGGKGDDLVYGEDDNDYLRGEDGNDILYGGLGNDAIEGNNQNDQLFGNEGNDNLFGGDDNDTLTGGTGDDSLYGDQKADILIGVNPNSSLPGYGEIDRLEGGDQNDLFILGDANKVYYNDGLSLFSGSSDYALITDFSVIEGDKIQLRGTAANYRLGNPSFGLPSGRAIYLQTGFVDELIAIVQGDTNLNLTSSAFTYV